MPGFQKVRNVERDPRVAVCVADPADPSRYFAIRGRVVKVTTLTVTYHAGGTQPVDLDHSGGVSTT